MTPSQSAGRNIARQRQRHHLSLDALAAGSQLPVSRLRDIEQGVGRITVEEFCRIARALGCDPCELLLGSRETPRKH